MSLVIRLFRSSDPAWTGLTGVVRELLEFCSATFSSSFGVSGDPAVPFE
jgi:hypothetical protein